jgi:hypothetical protein
MIPRRRRRIPCISCRLWFVVILVVESAAAATAGGRFDNLHFFLRQSVAQSSTTFGLLRSIPILQQQYRQRRQSSGSSINDSRHEDNNNSNHDGSMTRISEQDEDRKGSTINNHKQNRQQEARVRQVSTAAIKAKQDDKTERKKKKRRKLFKMLSGLSSSTGFFYGLDSKTVEKATKQPVGKIKPLAMKEALGLTLEELRTMRQEMEALRKEMEVLKRQLAGQEEDDEEGVMPGEGGENLLLAPSKMALSKRQREYDKIARDVEKWAENLLYQDKSDNGAHGWTEVQCNKMLKSALNKDGQTTAYVKWMVDSRGAHANQNDDREYPCLIMESTIDAPLDVVCLYLAQKDRLPEYNDLITNQKDVEEIAPHCKICWSQTPSLLFIKPRDFITYCHHKWLKDGTQVVVNQALDDHPKKEALVQGRAMAYALRGANYIGRDPQHPLEKTRIRIIAHGKAGVGVPDWACRTAIKSLTPIEPFKFFAKLNESIKRARPALEEEIKTRQQGMNDSDGDTDATAMVSTSTGRSKRPAGLAQLGYACFWPDGGGLVKGWQPTPSIVKTDSGGEGSSSGSAEEMNAPQPSSSSDNDDASEKNDADRVPQSTLQQQKDPPEVDIATEPEIERTTILGVENDSIEKKEKIANNDDDNAHPGNTQDRKRHDHGVDDGRNNIVDPEQEDSTWYS